MEKKNRINSQRHIYSAGVKQYYLFFVLFYFRNEIDGWKKSKIKIKINFDQNEKEDKKSNTCYIYIYCIRHVVHELKLLSSLFCL